jgi:hypothetical protein
MSVLLWKLDPTGEQITAASIMTAEGRTKLADYIPDWDKHSSNSSIYRGHATNIYQFKDGKYFHLHGMFVKPGDKSAPCENCELLLTLVAGSLNPEPTLKSLELPLDMESASTPEALDIFKKAVAQQTGEEMQHLTTYVFRQAGTICYTKEEYKASEHGKANAHVGLFEIHSHPNPTQKPGWWPETAASSVARPLAGLKVVDLTRIIAAPVISRGLAELGASVMRVVAPHITDARRCTLTLTMASGTPASISDKRRTERSFAR